MMKEGWVYRKWIDVLTIINGRNQKEVESKNGKYPICGSGGIMGYANDYLCPEETVIIGRKGNINNPIFMKQKFWNVDTAFGLVANTTYLLPRFLFYFCKEYDFERHNRAVTIPSLTKKDLYDILIPLPSICKQEAIVTKLDKLNEILAKKREQLKELDRLGQAVFYDMFGDPILNDRKWKSCNLSQICDVGSSKRVFVEDLVEKGIPFYRGTEIAVLSLGDKIIPKFYITEEHYNRLKELTGTPVYGDLLLPSICHEGKIWRVNTNEPFYFKDGRVLWIHLNSKDVNGTYLQYMLREKIMKDYINIASGTTFSELKIFALKKVVVILPPIDLQMKFAEQINAIESQKQKIKQSIVEVQQLLDYTMNKYFG